MFAPMLEGAASVLGLANHHPVPLAFQSGSQLRADHRVVVYEKNTDHAAPFFQKVRKREEAAAHLVHRYCQGTAPRNRMAIQREPDEAGRFPFPGVRSN